MEAHKNQVIKDTITNCLSSDTLMDLAYITGKKRSDTGGIMRLFPEDVRQIGGVGVGRAVSYRVLNTQTLCPICKRPLNGSYVRRGDFVFLESECSDCGAFSTLASEHADDFIDWTKYETVTVPPKQALVPGKKLGGEFGSECPLHCGTCENHLMTACCVLLDVTARCNQHCPWCFAAAESDKDSDPTLDTIEKWYDRLMELGEERPFNIQLSGGEPTVREDLPQVIRMGREKGFDYIQLNTNGRKLGEDEGYARQLADAGLTTVFLQFDGMSDDIYREMRGEPLIDIKKKAVENCAKVGLPVTLVPTILRHVNLNDIGNIFAYMKDNLNVIKGIHFQPASFFGRYPGNNAAPETDDYGRVTMFALMREIERQTGGEINRKELIPISTGHPLCCFCSSFLLEKGGGVTSLITDKQKEAGASCCCAEPDPLEIIRKDRDYVLNKWTVSSGEDLCGGAETEVEQSFDAALDWLKSHMFTISAMAFMDVSNLDAERLKRCRVQYFTGDGRLIPFCAYNSVYR
jgi:uncharacterized radical SAM superfamily Fe-S cluster-containing enzyme